MEFNNIVIEVLDLEHGQKVKKFWESKGINVGARRFSIYKNKNGAMCSHYYYYGVINGVFDNYSIKEVNTANAKIITLPPKFFPGDRVRVVYGEFSGKPLSKIVNDLTGTIIFHIPPYTNYYRTRKNKIIYNMIDDDGKYYALGEDAILESYNPPVKFQFQDGDGVVCDNKEANVLLDIAKENGYKVYFNLNPFVNRFNFLVGFVYSENEFVHYNVKSNFKRIFSPSDFEALVTGRLPEYWCFDIREEHSGEALDYLNKNYCKCNKWAGTGFFLYGYDASNGDGTKNSLNIESFKAGTILLPVSYILQAIKNENNIKQLNMEQQTITRAGAKEIYNIVTCSEWKNRINEKIAKHPFDDLIPVTNEEIKEMFEAVNSNTNILSVLSKYFKYPEEKLNNTITKYPCVEDEHFFINGTNAGCIYHKELQITNNPKGAQLSDHGANLYLTRNSNNGTWYDEDGNNIRGYLFFKPS